MNRSELLQEYTSLWKQYEVARQAGVRYVVVEGYMLRVGQALLGITTYLWQHPDDPEMQLGKRCLEEILDVRKFGIL